MKDFISKIEGFTSNDGVFLPTRIYANLLEIVVKNKVIDFYSVWHTKVVPLDNRKTYLGNYYDCLERIYLHDMKGKDVPPRIFISQTIGGLFTPTEETEIVRIEAEFIGAFNKYLLGYYNKWGITDVYYVYDTVLEKLQEEFIDSMKFDDFILCHIQGGGYVLIGKDLQDEKVRLCLQGTPHNDTLLEESRRLCDKLKLCAKRGIIGQSGLYFE